MTWALLFLIAADAPDPVRAAVRLQSSSVRLNKAALRIAEVGLQVETTGLPQRMSQVESELVGVLEGVARVELDLAALREAIEASAP